MLKGKILHINTYDFYGGAEEFATFLSKETNSYLIVKEKKTENQLVIELKKSFLDKLFLFLDKIVWHIGIKKTFKQIFTLSETYNCFYKKIAKLQVYKDAQIIHFHNLHGGYFDISSIGKIAKEKQIIWTLHDYWALTGGEAYIFEFQGYKNGNAKSPYRVHYPLNNPIVDKRQYFLEKKKDLFSQVGKNLTFVCPSKTVLIDAKQSFVLNKNNGLKHIYNGIDNVFVNHNTRTWETPKILFFNSTSNFKNSQYIIDNLGYIDFNIELHVFGKNLNLLSNFKIINHGIITDRDEMCNLYNSCDILIFSTNIETFGLIPAEAAACGCLTFASDIPIMREHQELYTLKLFSNSQPDDFINKLKYFSNNLSESRKLGKLASVQIKKTLSRQQTIKEYKSLYNLYLK